MLATMTKTVLVVDDEKDIRDLIAYNLSKEGFAVLTAADGNEALLKMEEHKVAVVILDIMMPGMDGFEVCRRIRAKEAKSVGPIRQSMPVIFLTARSGEADQIIGLELGADDYIQKPVSPRVLVARVKSILRRTERPELYSMSDDAGKEQISVGDILIDRASYKVHIDGSEVFFPRKEFELLYFLATHPGRVYSREALLNRVWGEGAYVVERTVDVHIFKVREKLGARGEKIETVKGVGYRFIS
ncbi:MAG: response regulator [Candidatus Kapaibacterium sp.]|jgi:two-component system alkaline phosphatase synthesis response regulator PhoP